jgi:hypothetical protein
MLCSMPTASDLAQAAQVDFFTTPFSPQLKAVLELRLLRDEFFTSSPGVGLFW